MTVFCYKQMAPVMRLGEKLKKTREDRGLALTTVSEATRIPLKYLEALESGHYSKLPKAKAHRQAYIREVSKMLGLSGAENLEQFEKEFGFADAHHGLPHRGIRLFPVASVSIFIRNSVAFAMVLIFAGYLVWQVRGILQPPHLVVFAPSEGYISNSSRTTIEGEAEKESRLTVNGAEIMVNEEGRFSAQIDLSPGVNTIRISATKKHGKTTTVTRHIVVKLSAGTDHVTLQNY